ncbi:hypothetical protein BGX38DRAFT_1268017 [Terfezia claveryi]|nr:hypothetical protein BGX38DRAFT_1268017 [Terfezia claveryi]
MSQSPSLSEQPTQEQSQGEPSKKRLHYTPQLKLQLICLCVENRERYIEESLETTFWQYISILFKEISSHHGADVRKKVISMVSECKATLEARKQLSGVALPPVTDLEQAIDLWIELCERRTENKKNIKAEASAEVNNDKVIAEVMRDNLTKRLGKKHDFQAVVEAREVVDLTAPGDIIQKRRQIRQNLRASKNDSTHRDECRQAMRDDLHKLTEVLVGYMTKATSGSSPPILASPTSSSIASSSTASSSTASSSTASSSTALQVTTSSVALSAATASDVAELKAKVNEIYDLKEEMKEIKELVMQLVKDKMSS